MSFSFNPELKVDESATLKLTTPHMVFTRNIGPDQNLISLEVIYDPELAWWIVIEPTIS